jgi:hypothetical protein
MKEKKLLLVFGFLIFIFNSNAQSWMWANGYGGSDFESSEQVATDSQGNSYIVGWFMSSSITFGTITHDLSTTNDTDGFLTKLDSNGVVLWSKKIATDLPDFVYAVSTDNDDNVIIAGTYNATGIALGNGVNLINDAPSISNIFVAKFNPSGEAQWAYSTNNSQTNGVDIKDLTVDSQNNIYALGSFGGINFCSFGINPITTFEDTLNSNNWGNSFYVKLNSDGDYQSVVRVKSDDYNSSTGVEGPVLIEVDADGNVYTAGLYEKENPVGDDVFDFLITKRNNAGTILFDKEFGGENNDYMEDLDIDADGNIYFTGLQNSMDMTLGSTTLTKPFTNDDEVRFAASLNPNENFRWAKIYGASQSRGNGIAISNDGKLYLGGTFTDTLFSGLTFPQGQNIVYNLNPNNGNINWQITAGQLFTEGGFIFMSDIECDASGRVIAYGTNLCETSGAHFGSEDLVSNGISDLYLARISSGGVAEIKSLNEINYSIFPNPTENYLTINLFQQGENTIQLIDASGKVIYEKQTSTMQNNINLEQFEKGVYFMKIINNLNNSIVEKIIKE